ncbi:hypothetical protein [Streptomyces sp. S.PB5]|uniref:hypothetical protein n=1 Tax=Streptomyces sp. S.PB5 TaxID=3020844 RepID=UPI0025B20F91|nr:hypothetical protein [Streptomyces sp. S.PB5]MDN3022083.1 hypothetical protein [Streptomyces sp. S.PB5]
MQTIHTRTSSTDLSPLLMGAATGIGGLGAILALAGSDSALRGPFTLFFLLAAPAVAVAAALRGLDPLGRMLAALACSVVLNMLVAQGMLATHRWSWRGGIVAVTVISSLLLLLVQVRRRRGRTTTGRTP